MIFRTLFKTRIYGMENVPKSGPYLIAHNHVSVIEPGLILSFWPVNAEAIGAQELWTRRGVSSLIRFYGTTPVHRGTADMALIKTILSVVEKGSPLLIAPEGTRSHVPGLGKAQPGIGYVIEKADVPVLPVAIEGSSDENLKRSFKLERPALTMTVGKPFKLPPILGKGKERRQARQERADEVLVKVGAMLPPEYWGEYTTQIGDFLQKAG